MENKYITKCRYCKLEFNSNHLNRRYCSDKCKRAAFRDKKAKERETKKEEQKIMDENSLILQELHKNNITITKDILNEKQFDLYYYYNKVKLKNGGLYSFNSDYHLHISKDEIKIIKN